MAPSEPLPTCRRKALWFGGFGVAALVLAGAMHLLGAPVSDWVLGLVCGFGVGGLMAAAMLWWLPDSSDAVPKRLSARYRREMLWPMAGYVLAVFAFKPLLNRTDSVPLRVIVSLLPALFALGVMR